MAYYSDIDLTLTKERTGDIRKNVDIEAVKNSIRNILGTMQGQRRMLPEFANNMYSYLFEPLDEITAYDIGENILETIQIWDDRVLVEEVVVIPNHDKSQYDIRLTFGIRNIVEKEEITYILRKL